MAGKLNGVIPATTPRGCNSLQQSIDDPTFLLCSPFKNSGAEQAYSTFSIPLWSSPIASWEILPCSSPISWQILLEFFSSSSLKRYIILARLIMGVSFHIGNAFSALIIAFSTVSLVARFRLLLIEPFAGL